MTSTHRAVTTLVRAMTRIVCRVHDTELARVPPRGPLILAANHINFLEVPLVYTHLLPRPIAGFAKVESWDNPILRWWFDLIGAIPLRRGEADAEAMRCALAALDAGRILAIAPEGTRSGHGRLQRARPGVALLALHSGAPVLPLAYYGGEALYRNLARLRRTDFCIAVGRPFHVRADGVKATREVRRQIADEIMYQIAALLPPAYRGHYADPSAATVEFLRFLRE